MKKVKKFFSNSWAMFVRCNKLSFRNLDALIMSIMMPAVLMVTFVYLFGGAMDTSHVGQSYVNYVVAGVIILCIGQCASSTAISINQDMESGMIDRFLSMSITRASFLMGHLLAAVLRNIMSTIVVVCIALLIGFSPVAGFGDWLVIIFLLMLFMFVMTLLSMFVGLLAKSPEGAGAFMIIAMLLPYLSSGFVPTSTMPTVLRVISEHQPMTPIIESIRSLFLESTAGNKIWLAFGWLAGLLVFSYIITVLIFKKRTAK